MATVLDGVNPYDPIATADAYRAPHMFSGVEYMKNDTTRQAGTLRLVFFVLSIFSFILIVLSILSLLWGAFFLIQDRVSSWSAAGFPEPAPFSRTFLQVVLGALAICTAVAWAGWFPKETAALRSKVSAFLSQHFLTTSMALSVVTLIVLLLTAALVLQQFPNSGDEYAYLFQARTFASGRLWNEPPPLERFFTLNWILVKDGKWVSQYPPGWPGLLMLGSLLGFPEWMVNPILGSLSIVVLILLTQCLEGTTVALVAALMLATTPFFIFNAASYFPHVSVSLAALVLAYFGVRFRASGKAIDALLMGGALGVIGLTRYYSSILFFGSLLIFVLCTRPPKRLLMFLWICVGAVPCLSMLLLYNHAITGHALQNTMQWGYVKLPTDSIGNFISMAFVRNAVNQIIENSKDLISFSSFIILVLYVISLLVKASKRDLQFYDFFFIAFVLGYTLFSFSAGNRYGPRYYYDAFPFLILTVVSGAHHIISSTKSHIARHVTVHALIITVMLSLCSLPFVGLDTYKVIDERRDVFRLIETQGIRNAVVVLSNGTGVLWPMSTDDLVRNGTAIGSAVIFAHDLGQENCKLQALFPERHFWVYKREPHTVQGRLEPPAWGDCTQAL